MVDHLIKNSRKEQSEFQLIQNETKYEGLLELIDDRIKITLTLGLSQFKWCVLYSIEQLYKLNAMFMICNTIEKSFEYFKDILKGNNFEVKRDGQKIILTYNQLIFNVQLKFDIELMQEQISTNDVMNNMNHSILEIQKEIEELKMNLKNKDQKMKEQDEIITCQKNEIEELKSDMKKLQEDNLKLINVVEKYVQPRFRQPMYSEVLTNKDVERLGEWIHQGKKQMQLKLIYQASIHGFETAKFYQRCSNITPTLIVIETTNVRRFGGYTDLLWTNNGNYIASNPNKSFLFSLDLNKKLTSNEPNCQYAIKGDSSYYAFGSGCDLQISNNSNTKNSGVYCGSTYGKNEGISAFDLNGGNQYFLTREIVVFQVLLN